MPIICAILSGILATFITIFYTRRLELRKEKIELIKNIVGRLSQLTEEYHGEVDLPMYLNQVYIIFNTSKETIKQLDLIKNNTGMDKNNICVNLIKSMCKDVNLKLENINDSFITSPFMVRNKG